ncbi:hypothetical protein C1H46_011002 [Malus baccata]|uniref:Uncharacterized protein n=1 Tax=Malus baccata TaxID=106549 RepID=A0A540MX39_MALBA|nr:hypothetical protein C1H46_011002 [Malus baccata]
MKVRPNQTVDNLSTTHQQHQRHTTAVSQKKPHASSIPREGEKERISRRGGGRVASNGKGNNGISGILVGSRKMVQSLKEIVNNCTEKPNLIRNFDTFIQSSRNPIWPPMFFMA